MSGKYIVVFKDHATREQIQKHIENLHADGGSVTHRYDTVLKGFAAEIPDAHHAQLSSLQSDPNSPIDYIERDGVVTTQ